MAQSKVSPGTWSAFNRYLYVSFKQNSWPSCYPPTKSEGYSFGVVRGSVRPFRQSVYTFCLCGTISQYLILVRFDSFLVQMISNMDSRYPISLVKIDSLTLELLPCFGISNYKAKPRLAFLCDDLHISSKLLYLTTSHDRP